MAGRGYSFCSFLMLSVLVHASAEPMLRKGLHGKAIASHKQAAVSDRPV